MYQTLKLLILLAAVMQLTQAAVDAEEDKSDSSDYSLEETKPRSKISTEELMTTFIEAVSVGNLEQVRDFIKSGVDINANDSFGDFAIIVAAEHEYPAIVKLLIEAGADVNVQGGKFGAPALMWAIASNDTETCRMLLDAGADVNIRFGITPLAYAATQNNLQLFQMLLENGAQVNNMEPYDSNALYYAVFNGNVEIAKILVQQGANVNNVKDYDGKSLLHVALKYEQTEMVAYLQSIGATE